MKNQTNKMKFLLLISLGFLSIYASAHFWYGKTLNQRSVEAKWGNQNFDVLKFKNGSVENRAGMASSLLKSKKTWIGKSYLEVEKQLGRHDGYYFNDIYPAYFIQIGETRKEETWQIVFLFARDRNISDIIVHKNCCD